jgi:hypothetical protein
MQKDALDRDELIQLVKSVFPFAPLGGTLVVLMDVPDRTVPDQEEWRDRRRIAGKWARTLKGAIGDLNVDRVDLVAYQNVGSNNADLPAEAFVWTGEEPPNSLEDLWRSARELSFDKVFTSARLILAPTEFSTTAPLKVAAPYYGFRAATMPGFSKAMIPALRLDYEEINRRVTLLKDKLDPVTMAVVSFRVDGKDSYLMEMDLRHRQAHASGGCFPREGEAGNLPSGETYIVPYEGEVDEASLTSGTLPVQHGKDVVYYDVQANRAVGVSGEGEAAAGEAKLLAREPAYGNIAELGFGVLGDFGLEPIGQILLDEKLGFHIAFGRSDHFGGAVGPADFTSPQAVVHIDRIYIPSTQPRVHVEKIELKMPGGATEILMRDGRYTCF